MDSKVVLSLYASRVSKYYTVCVSRAARWQNLLGGAGVADDKWHTVRFSRRASNLKLQVDGGQPVRGTLCTYARDTTRTVLFLPLPSGT